MTGSSTSSNWSKKIANSVFLAMFMLFYLVIMKVVNYHENFTHQSLPLPIAKSRGNQTQGYAKTNVYMDGQFHSNQIDERAENSMDSQIHNGKTINTVIIPQNNETDAQFTRSMYITPNNSQWHTLYLHSFSNYIKTLPRLHGPNSAVGVIRKNAWIDQRPEIADAPCLRLFVILKSEFLNLINDTQFQPMLTLVLRFGDQYVPVTYTNDQNHQDKLDDRSVWQFHLLYSLEEVLKTYNKEEMASTAILKLQNTDLEIRLDYIQPQYSQGEIGDFFVCVNSRYGTFPQEDEDFFMEWVEFNILMGVSEIHVFKGTWKTSPRMQKILEMYRMRGLVYVDTIEPPFYIKHNNGYPKCTTCQYEMKHLINQLVLQTCLYSNLHRFKFMIAIDPDEIIVPVKAANYSQMLFPFANRFHSLSYKCLWRLYGLFLNYSTSTNSNDVTNTSVKTSELVSMKYRKWVHSNRLTQGKSFVRTESCGYTNCHTCVNPKVKNLHGMTSTPYCYTHHYRKKCKSNDKRCWEEPKLANQILRFKDSLTQRYDSAKLKLSELQYT